MIITKNISKKYGKSVVLSIDNLEIPTGQCFGLVGNNGAGKTTYFNILLDLIKPTTGEVINNKIQVNSSEKWKKFTNSFIDDSFLIGYLTPKEYFQFIAELRGINKEDISVFLDKFKEFFNGEVIEKNNYLRDLSKGVRKKVGIVASLIENPKVIILDEPFANLDPTSQIVLKGIFKELTANKEITLIISSHELNHTIQVCDRIVVLENGKVIKDIITSPETLNELEKYFSI